MEKKVRNVIYLEQKYNERPVLVPVSTHNYTGHVCHLAIKLPKT